MSRFTLFGWMLLLAVVGSPLIGCHKFNLRSQSPDDEKLDDEFETTVKTPLIGDYTTIAGLNLVTLEGVGLVTGLDGTGGDPPPSMFRTALLEDMKKRNVRNPNRILQAPTTALVIIRAYLPPLIRRGEKFDIEVRLPGNSDATSLNGGRLLAAHLSEQAIVPGRGLLKGHMFAKAKGPILISSGEGDKASLAGVLRRGRILGGGVSLKDRDLAIYLRNDFRSVRNSNRIASRIGQRFHGYNKYGLKEPLADAKTDQTIILKVHKQYKENFPRYLQVVRSIAFRETTVAQRVRMQKLKRQLNDPQTSAKAALQLEAIGNTSIPFLKAALKNPSLEVRFYVAEALAYLEDASGLKVLAEAARKERAFRVFAFAAMEAIDEPESHLLLRELMSEHRDENDEVHDSAETRYGAFRALWTLDRNDPFIEGQKLNDEYSLHVLATQGEPMIHVTHRRRAEVVLFGSDQQFRTPIAVKAGNHILVTAKPASETITISRFEAGKPDQRRVVSSRVADVIRTAAEFGATYPDIAQMLIQANNQHNIPGRIEIDALPQAGRVYFRPDSNIGSRKKKTRVGRPNLVPNMFPTIKNESDSSKRRLTDATSRSVDSDPSDDASDDSSGDPAFGTASVSDIRKPDVGDEDRDGGGKDSGRTADEESGKTAEKTTGKQDSGNTGRSRFNLFKFAKKPVDAVRGIGRNNSEPPVDDDDAASQ